MGVAGAVVEEYGHFHGRIWKTFNFLPVFALFCMYKNKWPLGGHHSSSCISELLIRS